MLASDIRKQIIEGFKAELTEHTQKITEGLLTLEQNPPAEQKKPLLEEIFREAHSLKGAARAVGMTHIETISHQMEDLLLLAKDTNLTLSTPAYDLLYQAIDDIGVIMAEAEGGSATLPPKVLTNLTKLEEMVAEYRASLPKAPPPSTTPAESAKAASNEVEAETPSAPPSPADDDGDDGDDDNPQPSGANSGRLRGQQDETIRVSVPRCYWAFSSRPADQFPHCRLFHLRERAKYYSPSASNRASAHSASR